MGSKALRGKLLENIAPANEPINAIIAIGIVAFTSFGIFLKYVLVAPAVPKMLDALLVPNNCAGVALGNPKSKAGN